jgi:hypothetical protein
MLDKIEKIVDKMGPTDTDEILERIIAALDDLDKRVSKLEEE